jgi:exonuclease 1
MWKKVDQDDEKAVSEAMSFFQRATTVTDEMQRRFIQLLKEHNISYVVAPYEADAQIAALYDSKQIDLVITEDSDLIVFGCPVFVKLESTGFGVEIDLDAFRRDHDITSARYQIAKQNPSLLKVKNMSHEHFRAACVLSGCDYAKNMPNVGLKTAIRLVCHYPACSVDSMLCRLKNSKKLKRYSRHITPQYASDFYRAIHLFDHQPVYHHSTRSISWRKPLPKLDSATTQYHTLHGLRLGVYSDDLSFLGQYVLSVDSIVFAWYIATRGWHFAFHSPLSLPFPSLPFPSLPFPSLSLCQSS